MMEKVLARILRESDSPRLWEALTQRLSLTDLQSLMTQYADNRFTRPSQQNPLVMLEWDRLAFSLLPAGFEVVELSPVCPLGTCSVVATVDQNKVLTTTRNTEMVADSTNVLALECARRRREVKGTANLTRLSASQRVIRTQSFGGAGMAAHFRLLSLCTAGRDTGSYQFEIAALLEHIDFYIRLFGAAAENGFNRAGIEVWLTAFDERRLEALDNGVRQVLAARYPEVTFGFNAEREQGRNYYIGSAFEIRLRDGEGEAYQICDGGFTDWTQQLMGNGKERFLVSAAGSERFIALFGAAVGQKEA
jgi:hypothetical protein